VLSARSAKAMPPAHRRQQRTYGRHRAILITWLHGAVADSAIVKSIASPTGRRKIQTVPDLTNLSTELGPGADRGFHLPGYGHIGDARFVPGQIFASRYRIVSLLGRGAMGEVYRAEDLKLGQPVALKLVAVSAARDADRVQRFITEVRLARTIAHPNVCRVYDIGEADGWWYISMELVDGETLASLLRRIGR